MHPYREPPTTKYDETIDVGLEELVFGLTFLVLGAIRVVIALVARAPLDAETVTAIVLIVGGGRWSLRQIGRRGIRLQ